MEASDLTTGRSVPRIMAGSDLAANARTLDRLGLAGKNAEQIKHVMQDGF